MEFYLKDESINDIVRDSMLDVIKLARQAHFTDIHMRINGEWRRFEADWIKHLEPR